MTATSQIPNLSGQPPAEPETHALTFDDARAEAAAAQMISADTPQALLLSYAINNPETVPKTYGALFKIFKAVAEVGHNILPNQIKHHLIGKDVLDFGCGNTLYSAAFRALGARSYVGIDPRVEIGKRHFRSRYLKSSVKLDVSLEQVLSRMPNVEYYRSETAVEGRTFDFIVLHTVTEYLTDIEGTFAKLSRSLRPEGRIWFLHNNYSSWSGHQQVPSNLRSFDPSNVQHLRYADWAHLKVDPGGHDDRASRLNRIRLPALRQITEKYFRVLEWIDIEDSRAIQSRLTRSIEAEISDYSRPELLTKQVKCLAEKN